MGYITYKQADSRWGSKNYNGSSSMATAGCGPTSVAMLAYAVDGKTTPWDVAQYMKKNGYAVYNNGTAWAGIPAAMKYFGLTDVKNVAKMSTVWSYLAKGYCAVFLFRSGSKGGITWTTSGHYIAITNYKVEGGKHYLYTRDSGGRNHTGWYCYETQMMGLIPQIWVGLVPGKEKKDTSYKKKCIDVSEHQGKIDWKKVKEAGINYAIIRIGYGKNNIDGRFKENIEGALAAGVKVGGYWFSYAYTDTMAKNEAKYCAAALKPYKDKLSLPIFSDWEYASMDYAKRQLKSTPSKAMITKWVKLFCDGMKEAGYETGVYYNYDYKKNHIDLDKLKGYTRWYALYSDEKAEAEMQQYSSKGKVSGISGNVDMNYIYTKDIIKSASTTTTTTTTTTKTDSAPATYKTLRLNDEGTEVAILQNLLNEKNKGSILAALKPDGKFGAKTLAHVKLFQDARHLTVDGIVGPKTWAKLESCKIGKRRQAINWAVSIARDNRFMYGTGNRAHHGGCYFCGTNITGPKKATKGDKWEFTYCCNPFVFSAYAHGAKDSAMLKQCKKSNAKTGMDPKAWAEFNFEIVGKCKNVTFDKLKAGDVIMCKSHVWMYTGGNWLVEASGGGFTNNSIAHKKIAKSRYASYRQMSSAYVVRYKI